MDVEFNLQNGFLDRMERIYRKGFGCCLMSHKFFQPHRIINRSSSVSSVRFDSFAPAHSPCGPTSACSFSHLHRCSIRDLLGLVPGSVLDFQATQGSIVVSKVLAKDAIQSWRGKGKLPVGQSVMEYLKIQRDGK